MTTAAIALYLDASVRADIEAHGVATYPNECCGALLGRSEDRRIRAALALPNSTEEGPRRRFLIRPADYLASERRARERGLDLLGFYHSHPDHPARPSQHDLAHAWPNLDYVIVSVVAGRPADLRSWRLADDRSAFGEVEVRTPQA